MKRLRSDFAKETAKISERQSAFAFFRIRQVNHGKAAALLLQRDEIAATDRSVRRIVIMKQSSHNRES